MSTKSTMILVRHGQSMWNKKNLFTGWVDVPLSPKGIEAALAAGMSVVVVPDHNMDHKFYKNASQIISSLKDFDPEYWGLPKYNKAI